MCKDKDVHNVNGMMSSCSPHRQACRASRSTITAGVAGSWTHKRLDCRTYCIIIVFTASHGRSATDQTIISPRERDTQPAAARGKKRDLSGQRLLRSRRSATGQIRNAPPRRGRQAIGQRGSEGIRLLATVLLSGTGSISGRRACRPAAAQARSTIRAQADARPDELRGGTPHRRSAHFQSATGQSNRRTLWHRGSPPQHRPAVAPSKKTPVNGAPAAVSPNDRRLVAAYEELRAQAVERWQRGPGLALMRTRGLRCWMEACRQFVETSSSAGISSRKERPETDVPTGVRGEIVVLLANMLLHTVFRGVA
jgi:hypothetical protein